MMQKSWRVALAALAALHVWGQSALSEEVSVISRDGYVPLTTREWPEGGLAIEVLLRSWGEDDEGLNLSWSQSGADPLTAVHEHRFDLGLLWPRPVCTKVADSPMCTAFHFSDPVAELVWLLFTPHDREFVFNTPADLSNKTVCLSDAGHPTRWGGAGQGVVEQLPAEIRRASDLPACFDLLVAGRVDAVLADEFTGIRTLFENKLTETVVPLPKPVGVQSLHVVASVTHWRATTMLYRFNSGLADLRKSGEYRDILARNVTRFWEALKD